MWLNNLSTRFFRRHSFSAVVHARLARRKPPNSPCCARLNPHHARAPFGHNLHTPPHPTMRTTLRSVVRAAPRSLPPRRPSASTLRRRGPAPPASGGGVRAASSSATEEAPPKPAGAPPPSSTPRVCVLGGGFGGLYTAVRLEGLLWPSGKRPAVTLIDKGDRFVFKPLLYELLAGTANDDEVAPPFARLLASYRTAFVQGAVSRVEPGTGENAWEWRVCGRPLPMKLLIFTLPLFPHTPRRRSRHPGRRGVHRLRLARPGPGVGDCHVWRAGRARAVCWVQHVRRRARA